MISNLEKNQPKLLVSKIEQSLKFPSEIASW